MILVKQVSIAMYDVLSQIYMRTPSTENEWKHIAEDFAELWNLPHCLGAIDGKHIGVDCPQKVGHITIIIKIFFVWYF